MTDGYVPEPLPAAPSVSAALIAFLESPIKLPRRKGPISVFQLLGEIRDKINPAISNWDRASTPRIDLSDNNHSRLTFLMHGGVKDLNSIIREALSAYAVAKEDEELQKMFGTEYPSGGKSFKNNPEALVSFAERIPGAIGYAKNILEEMDKSHIFTGSESLEKAIDEVQKIYEQTIGNALAHHQVGPRSKPSMAIS